MSTTQKSSDAPIKADPVANPNSDFSLAGMAEMAAEKFKDQPFAAEIDEASLQADKEAAAGGEKEEPIVEEEPKIEDPSLTPTAEELAAKAEADAEKLAEDAAKAEADAKEAEEKARVAELRKTRDADLQPDPESTAHMRPGTRKHFEKAEAAARKARDEADIARKEAEDLKKQLTDAQAAARAGTAPEEITKERDLYRERVRELDAERDPEIERKYSAKIKSNDDAIIEVLKEYKFDKIANKDGSLVDNPQAITDLMKKGLSFGTLRPSIEALEKAGLPDAAESLREMLRDNLRLSRDRQVEVQAIKGDVEARKATRTANQTAEMDAMTRDVSAEATRMLQSDVGELSKKFTYLVKPSAPLATDTPAVAAAKRAAVAEFDKIEAEIGKAAGGIASRGKTGKEFVAAEARRYALALQSVIYRQRVIPKFEADLAKATARVKELEAELGKIRGAGTISRAHGTAAQVTKGKADINPNLSTADAFAEFAKSQGVSVNT